MRMTDAIEYEESVVHDDSNNVRGNFQQGNEESASKAKRQRLTEKFEWKDKTVETLIIL